METSGSLATEVTGAELARVLDVLQGLLDVRATSSTAAPDETADLLSEAFRADMVDVMLYEAGSARPGCESSGAGT